eukprot:COSAG06_NODE_5791_length_3272_cov_22.469587_2_plen_94_part_00
MQLIALSEEARQLICFIGTVCLVLAMRARSSTCSVALERTVSRALPDLASLYRSPKVLVENSHPHSTTKTEDTGLTALDGLRIEQQLPCACRH